jgi:recombinational DNA repair ATPase RecF
MGPRIKSLSVRGFRAYGAAVQTLNLQTDIAVVWGPNSTGKTSLAEAFEFLLTGSTRAFRRQALLSRRALPDAAELALSGQRRAQGENLPRPARGDHRARTLAGCSGQARCRSARAVDGRWRRGAESVVGPDLR